VIEHRYYGAS
jgi:hypothetical protein